MTPRDDRFVLTGALLFDPARGFHSGEVWVRDGQIVAPMSGEGAEIPRVDLGGRLLLPGFWDAHCHFLFVGLQEVRPTLSGTRTRAEALDRLRQALDDPTQPESILAEGWDEADWPAADGPLTGADIDSLSTSRPVVARRVCTHIAVANRSALKYFDDSPHVDREVGRLVEGPAMRAATLLPGRDGERERAVGAATDAVHRQGIVGVHDLGRAEDLAILQRAARGGDWPLRIRYFLKHEDWHRLGREVLAGLQGPEDRVRLAGVKFFADGSFGARTAAVSDPYPDGKRGVLLWDGAELTDAVRAVHADGYRAAVHAIGDRALALVLDALEGAGVQGDRIEHVELSGDREIERLARLGITASMQPNFVARWAHPDGLYDRVLGPDRAPRTNRFRSLARAGVSLAFGSDAMPVGPLLGLAGALGHPEPAERLSVEEALAAYIAGGPHSVEERPGRLEPGHRADLALLSARAPDASSVTGAVVDATWVDGRCVYEREGAR